MLRRLVILVLVFGALGVAAFWVVTIPQTVPASALAPRNPDLANGRTMLHAGGCPACHATPKQDDATRLGGGLAIKTAFGTFYAPNISPDAKDGIGARVVSMPCWELFDAQEEQYRNAVLPLNITARVSVEAGATLGWERYVGLTGAAIGMHSFGASAPLKDLLKKFGFTADHVVAAAREVLGK